MSHAIVVHNAKKALQLQGVPVGAVLALAASSLTSRAIGDGLEQAIDRALLLPTYQSRERATQLLADRWMSMTAQQVVQDFDRRLANIPEQILKPHKDYDFSKGAWSVDRARFNYCSALMRAMQYCNSQLADLSESRSLEYSKIGKELKDAGFFEIITNPKLFDCYHSCKLLQKLGNDNSKAQPDWSWQGAEAVFPAELRERFPGIHSPQMYELIFFARMGGDLATFVYGKGVGLFKRKLRPEMYTALQKVIGESDSATAAGHELSSRSIPFASLKNVLFGISSVAKYYFEKVGDSAALKLLEQGEALACRTPESWQVTTR
jgi:hypothetical protein